MALDYKVIGERLKKARKSKNLTQEKLAEKLNVSVAFLSRIERGNSLVSLKRLNQICSILGTSESSILAGVSKESNFYLNKEFSDLLKDCPPEKLNLIYNVTKLIINN